MSIFEMPTPIHESGNSDGIPAAEVAKVIVRQLREGASGSVAPAGKF